MNGGWRDRTLLDLLTELGLELLPERDLPTDGWSGATFTSLVDSDGRRFVLKRTSLERRLDRPGDTRHGPSRGLVRRPAPRRARVDPEVDVAVSGRGRRWVGRGDRHARPVERADRVGAARPRPGHRSAHPRSGAARPRPAARGPMGVDRRWGERARRTAGAPLVSTPGTADAVVAALGRALPRRRESRRRAIPGGLGGVPPPGPVERAWSSSTASTRTPRRWSWRSRSCHGSASTATSSSRTSPCCPVMTVAFIDWQMTMRRRSRSSWAGSSSSNSGSPPARSRRRSSRRYRDAPRPTTSARVPRGRMRPGQGGRRLGRCSGDLTWIVGLLLRGWRKGLDAEAGVTLPSGDDRCGRPRVVVRARGRGCRAPALTPSARGGEVAAREDDQGVDHRRPRPRRRGSRSRERRAARSARAGHPGSGTASTAGGPAASGQSEPSDLEEVRDQHERERDAQGRRQPVERDRRRERDRREGAEQQHAVQPEERQVAHSELVQRGPSRPCRPASPRVRAATVTADEQRRRQGEPSRTGLAARSAGRAAPRACRAGARPATAAAANPTANTRFSADRERVDEPEGDGAGQAEDVAAAELGELRRDERRCR